VPPPAASHPPSAALHPPSVAPFVTPNVRVKRGTYATFLHSDAVFEPTKASSPRAMINVWMPLADAPATQFHLCFHESPFRQQWQQQQQQWE
jgi:hypothetical protein